MSRRHIFSEQFAYQTDLLKLDVYTLLWWCWYRVRGTCRFTRNIPSWLIFLVNHDLFCWDDITSAIKSIKFYIRMNFTWTFSWKNVTCTRKIFYFGWKRVNKTSIENMMELILTSSHPTHFFTAYCNVDRVDCLWTILGM